MRLLALAFAVAGLSFAPSAGAVVWPDVTERVVRDLDATDPTVRLSATENLDALGTLRAKPFVLKALGDADLSVRVAAAEAAIRLHVPEATSVALPWLGERDARLRIASCNLARALPDARAVAPLARSLSDADATVRAGAAEALGVQGSADALAPLLGRLDDANPTVRVAVARALARLGDKRAVVPLVGKIEDSVAEVRQTVARALGELEDPRATPALVLALRDGSADVRIAALVALRRVRALDAVDVVRDLAIDRNGSVRNEALATLGGLAREGSADALGALVSRLGQGDDATSELVRTPLRSALLMAGDASVGELTKALRRGVSTAAATSVAWVLGELGAKSAAPDIVLALRHGTLPVAAGLHALAGAGTPAELPSVLEFVASDSAAVRHEALAATSALLDPAHPDGRAVDPLLDVATSPRLAPGERLAIIRLLGKTGAGRAAALLEGLARVPDLPTKLAALDALAELGDAGASSSMVDLLSDSRPVVRLRASLVLAAGGGAPARDALLAKLEDGTSLDRSAALSALGGILVRAPIDAAWPKLLHALGLSAGGERDALLIVLGRSAPVAILEELATSSDPHDRATLASATAGRADVAPILLRLLRDPDAAVRAEAAFSLGSVRAEGAIDELARVAHTTGPDALGAAVNATAALARISARGDAARVTPLLCALEDDARPLVKANALAAMALAGARCADGAKERTSLSDASEPVRRAAARVVGRSPRTPEDRAALARCAFGERSFEIAQACERPKGPPPTLTRATLSYVEPIFGAPPRPLASYVVELSDGLLRVGTADRRGAFFDPVAPMGVERLLPWAWSSF